MRQSSIGIGFLVSGLLLAAGTVGATDVQLLSVADKPELAPYAAQLRQLLNQKGAVCDQVAELNAFPHGTGLRTVAACSGGQRYEVLFVGNAIEVKQL